MLRLLIIAGLVYFLYRALSSRLLKHRPPSDGSVADKNAVAVDDIMVKDPQCDVYFPKRKAVRVTTDGQDLYFCSRECRDKYMLENNEN